MAASLHQGAHGHAVAAWNGRKNGFVENNP